jgi:hypothetical protein
MNQWLHTDAPSMTVLALLAFWVLVARSVLFGWGDGKKT